MHTLIGHVEEAKVHTYTACLQTLHFILFVYLPSCVLLQCIALKGCLAATGSWDHTLRVWNIHVGLCKYTLQGHTEGETNLFKFTYIHT